MSALARCRCGGFLPARAETCPHCRAPAKRSLRLGALCGIVGGTTVAFTLMACYGAAPCDGDDCTDLPNRDDAAADAGSD
ncbi:MAG: hypothetical protein KIT84_38930 [Labilithrix sp.]|nr:hypothetical protein [Labilithrix sp.]MCW5817037.1 hypothetical protein [Labilithrix sp.]